MRNLFKGDSLIATAPKQFKTFEINGNVYKRTWPQRSDYEYSFEGQPVVKGVFSKKKGVAHIAVSYFNLPPTDAEVLKVIARYDGVTAVVERRTTNGALVFSGAFLAMIGTFGVVYVNAMMQVEQ